MDKNSKLLLFIVIVIIGVFFVFLINKKKEINKNKNNNPLINQDWEGFNNLNNDIKIEPTPPSISQPDSYKQALENSAQTGKKVLVIFTATWCSPCNKLKKETLSSNEVKAAMNNFYVWNSDVDAEDIKNKFGVSGVPTYIILDSKETVLKKGVGYKSPQEFIDWIQL